jgi:hypothetical protein
VSLGGCYPFAERVRTVEVKVPVPVKAQPPRELQGSEALPPLPRWVGPQDPAASSCLTPTGEDQLREREGRAVEQLGGWSAWARDQPAEADP